MSEEKQTNKLGLAEHIADRIRTLRPEEKLQIVDVGCGRGEVVYRLSKDGHTVTGIEAFEEKVENLKANNNVENVNFMYGRGEKLPLEDASVDVVVFCNSLHHVPTEHQSEALAEAKRIVKPEGYVVVYEPIPAGKFQEVVAIFADETEWREHAWRIVEGADEKLGLNVVEKTEFENTYSTPSFEAAVGFMIHIEPSRKSIIEEKMEQIRSKFVENATAVKKEGSEEVIAYQFPQPMRTAVLSPKK